MCHFFKARRRMALSQSEVDRFEAVCVSARQSAEEREQDDIAARWHNRRKHRFGGPTEFYDSGLLAVEGQVFEEDFK